MTLFYLRVRVLKSCHPSGQTDFPIVYSVHIYQHLYWQLPSVSLVATVDHKLVRGTNFLDEFLHNRVFSWQSSELLNMAQVREMQLTSVEHFQRLDVGIGPTNAFLSWQEVLACE